MAQLNHTIVVEIALLIHSIANSGQSYYTSFGPVTTQELQRANPGAFLVDLEKRGVFKNRTISEKKAVIFDFGLKLNTLEDMVAKDETFKSEDGEIIKFTILKMQQVPECNRNLTKSFRPFLGDHHSMEIEYVCVLYRERFFLQRKYKIFFEAIRLDNLAKEIDYDRSYAKYYTWPCIWIPCTTFVLFGFTTFFLSRPTDSLERD